MKQKPSRPSETPGSLQAWLLDAAETNSDTVEHMRQAMRLAISEGLTARQREILLLHFYEEYSTAEIAQALGLNRTTVTRTLQRAKRRLRRLLNENQ